MSDPIRDYRMIVDDSGTNKYVNRILIGSPVTGLVRIEWVQGRFGQVIPVNWSQVMYLETMSGYWPLRYQVADAQNLIIKKAVELDFEWILLWEHDTIPPPDAIVKLNNYIIDDPKPVVSGLYYTRSRPSEPLIFKGRGTGSFRDFQFGDKVWCDGIPTGFILIHMGLLKLMWEESPEYILNKPNGQQVVVRRIFETPRKQTFDPNTGNTSTVEGTSDLDWCTRVMEGKYFERSGWVDFCPDMRYPFLVDTGIFCKHCNPDGEMFP
jgi:hypothetical protein